jgi:hypothetical protein
MRKIAADIGVTENARGPGAARRLPASIGTSPVELVCLALLLALLTLAGRILTVW